MAAAKRAFAAIRVGNLDLAEASIQAAHTGMSAEQRNGGAMGSRLEMLRGQLQRARRFACRCAVCTALGSAGGGTFAAR